MHEFGVSANHIRKVNVSAVIILLLVMLPCFVGLLIFLGFNIILVLIISAIAFLLSMLSVYLQNLRINKKLRNMKVCIADDKIVTKSQKKQREILWDNIVKIQILEDNKGNIKTIKVCDTSQKAVHLSGFSEMEKILQLIRNKVSSNVPYQKKKQILNWENPLVLLGFALLTIALIFPIIVWVDEYVLAPFIRLLFRLLGFDI